MKWMELPEGTLLNRIFLFGITGIVLGVISLINQNYPFFEGPMGPLNGVSIGLQLVALSIAVLLLRKRKISDSAKNKAQKMTVVLGAAALFFIFSL
ncbi:hypothetical protein [Algoriphagus sediminis]|uniref:Uncharacterized protein n=1 Tax=Algoriphagus sediminis TaxID=3057113 RepID=A0ABT7YGM2_9BACT|nr:hypothetical protein [Algoriphagus sediminis]MDN3205673.1 hypothetical protein [Algoriphagus sediminis]